MTGYSVIFTFLTVTFIYFCIKQSRGYDVKNIAPCIYCVLEHQISKVQSKFHLTYTSEQNGCQITSEQNGRKITSEQNGSKITSEKNGFQITSEQNGCQITTEQNGCKITGEQMAAKSRVNKMAAKSQVKKNGCKITSEQNGCQISDKIVVCSLTFVSIFDVLWLPTTFINDPPPLGCFPFLLLLQLLSGLLSQQQLHGASAKEIVLRL